MISFEELNFIAAFQPRLKSARLELDYSQERMALHLGITKDEYKKYESRPKSAFPMFLLPRLVELTGKPMQYWFGQPIRYDTRRGRARLTVVKSTDRA